MNRNPLFATALALALAAGCNDGESSQPKGTNPAPAPAPPAAATQPGAAKSDAHDDHEGEDHAEGELTSLGTGAVGTLQVEAKQEGALTPGGETGFEVVLPSGAPKPKAVRLWVGTADAEGSAKAKADAEGADAWHVHVEVPEPLPPGSKLWVELEPDAGPKVTGSFDLGRGAP